MCERIEEFVKIALKIWVIIVVIITMFIIITLNQNKIFELKSYKLFIWLFMNRSCLVLIYINEIIQINNIIKRKN